jgi:hypothetical protein
MYGIHGSFHFLVVLGDLVVNDGLEGFIDSWLCCIIVGAGRCAETHVTDDGTADFVFKLLAKVICQRQL